MWDRVRVAGREPVTLDLGCGGFLQYPTNIGGRPQAHARPGGAGGSRAAAAVRYRGRGPDLLVHLLEHLLDFLPLVDECHRVLRPGGVLHVLSPWWRRTSTPLPADRQPAGRATVASAARQPGRVDRLRRLHPGWAAARARPGAPCALLRLRATAVLTNLVFPSCSSWARPWRIGGVETLLVVSRRPSRCAGRRVGARDSSALDVRHVAGTPSNSGSAVRIDYLDQVLHDADRNRRMILCGLLVNQSPVGGGRSCRARRSHGRVCRSAACRRVAAPAADRIIGIRPCSVPRPR